MFFVKRCLKILVIGFSLIRLVLRGEVGLYVYVGGFWGWGLSGGGGSY